MDQVISIFMSSYACTLHFLFVWWDLKTTTKKVLCDEIEHRVSAWAGELGLFSSKCPSEYGQSWSPCSLVMASVPQTLQCMNTATCRDLLVNTNHTELKKQTAVCLQHMSDLYIIWFREKWFLECLCMNLNFKLFIFFNKSTDLFWKKCYVNIWFISYPGKKRFMYGYKIKSNVLVWRDVL